MTKSNIPGEIISQDEFMGLRILRRIPNQVAISAINLDGEQYSLSFTKAMCLLTQYGLIEFSNSGQVKKTEDGVKLLEDILELIEG